MIGIFLLQALLLALHVSAHNSTAGFNSTMNSTTPNIPSTRYPLTTDGVCGNNGRMCLVNGTSPCCSAAGYCGNGEQYCGKSTCQEDYGKCQSNDVTLDLPACSWASTGTSPRCDGKCGSAYNNAVCAQGVSSDAFAQFGVYDYGSCCSKGGFCGSSSAHCEVAQGCQSGCDNSTMPSSSTSAGQAAATSSSSATSNLLILTPRVTRAFAFSLVGFFIGL